jgi:hypothetical protein
MRQSGIPAAYQTYTRVTSWETRTAAVEARGDRIGLVDPFIEEARKELESDAGEIAIADAKNLVAVAGVDTVRRVFFRYER